MIVEDDGDQADRKHKACRQTPPEFEPNGVECDLFSEPLPLDVATDQVVRQDRHERADQEFEHALAPANVRSRRDLGSPQLEAAARLWLCDRSNGTGQRTVASAG